MLVPLEDFIWQQVDRLGTHDCWDTVGSYASGKVIVNLTEDVLDEANVVVLQVHGLVAVNSSSVQMLGLRPHLLNANGQKVWACCNVPDRLDCHLRRIHEVLNYMGTVYPGIIKAKSDFDSFAHVGTYFLQSVADIQGIEGVFTQLPVNNTLCSGDDTEDYDWLL